MRAPLLVLLLAGPALADDLQLREARALSVVKCLQLAPEEMALRCPTVAGRRLIADGEPLAVLDRLDKRRGTLLCDRSGSSWRCRKITVVDRDLRTTRTRNKQAFVTAGELLRTLATAATVKLDAELGALLPPRERPRTCTEVPSRGCAVQAVRLKGHAQKVRRRLWLVEDVDGTTLQCSDAELKRCDELTAAGWQTLALTLRPSSQAAPEPMPELDVPEVRSDKGTPGVADSAERQPADTPVGALDAWIKPKRGKALPPQPGRGELQKTAKALDARGKACLGRDQAQAAVDLIFTGEGQLVSVLVDGAQPGEPLQACLKDVARKLELPRFAGNTYRMRAMVVRGYGRR